MTNGGHALLAHIFRYRPGRQEGTPRERTTDQARTLCRAQNKALLSNCNNLTLAPWGDLILREDTSTVCRLIGVTTAGRYQVIAAGSEPGRELAGACFYPDGTILFVNVQNPGYTLAITGPWQSRRA
jgi:secreted PhoX family phosphatase